MTDTNYGDSHQSMYPFDFRWGRGILVRGPKYLEAIIGPYSTSHARLKNDLEEAETSGGAFYYGYDLRTRTLYLEYGSDRMFTFYDSEVLDAVMNSLRLSNGPLKDFVLISSDTR